jgi:uncharacterized protein
MPTNYLRRAAENPPPASKAPPQSRGSDVVELTIGGLPIRVQLHSTPSAQRIIAALPLFSIAETWGESIHFEIPISGGRDRTARLNAEIGGFYYWAEEQRLLLVFGPTPISGNGPIRLPRPCNVIGQTDDDLSSFRKIHPGQKVSLKRP